MKYFKFEDSDFDVSKICLGCMSFGKQKAMYEWTLNDDDAYNIISYSLNKGINFFDTANGYSDGESEKLLGKAIKRYTNRDKVIIASKVYFNDGHLKKEAIRREIEKTLLNLDTSYLDIYYIHRFDYSTPIYETMSTLNDLVKEGKVRALGASSMWGYQFNDYQQLALDNHFKKFSYMQNQYNLLYREEEREMNPICRKWNVKLVPFSPLAMGRLSRASWFSSSKRCESDKVAMAKYDVCKDEDIKIVKRVEELAIKHNTTMSAIALAWLFKKGVTAPIVGITKTKYLDDAINSLEISLSDEEENYLEELYTAHNVTSVLKKPK